MSMITLLIYLFGAVTLLGAVAVVLVKNVLHAALALLVTLLGIAAIYVLLMADLLAIIQLMVYVGGVLVLIIFGVMLSNSTVSGAMRVESHNPIWGILLMVIMLGGLTYLLALAHPQINAMAQAQGPELITTVQPAGIGLLTTFVLPFELVSVLLLVALVGAAYLAAPAKNQTANGLKDN